ncbi:hypothetical protein M885DRAFT_618969 [Pelagophyceae sp. CCMP2097]|nr:hypothetical protein M885DRAFT_618969 [Pelagophyceae sp. CCMP2097]
MPTRRGNHFQAVMQDGSGLSPIDADGDCQGPAIGMTYLTPPICMTMYDVAPIICDDPADDDGPLSSVSLFAEEALDSLRDDTRDAPTRNSFSLDKPAFKEMDDEDDASHDYDYDDQDECDACGDHC